MIIKFKYREYSEICDEYAALFKYEEPRTTDEQDGNAFGVYGSRIVFPELHASFREADWWTRNEDVEDPDDVEAWGVQGSGYMLYGETEKDINQYVSFLTGPLGNSVHEACLNAHYPFEKIDDLACYIDTSEFVDEEIAQRLFPKNW